MWPFETPEKEKLWPFKFIVTEIPGDTAVGAPLCGPPVSPHVPAYSVELAGLYRLPKLLSNLKTSV